MYFSGPLRVLNVTGNVTSTLEILKWCCYIMVDSSKTATQNGFCSNKLFLHKNILFRIWQKHYYILYHREVLKLDHFKTHFLSYACIVL